MATCREMVLLLDLCLPHQIRKKKEEDFFIKIITMNDMGLLKQTSFNKVKKMYQDWFIDDGTKLTPKIIPKVKFVKIISCPSFGFPSKFEIEMDPMWPLNGNIIRLFAMKWFCINGTIPGTIIAMRKNMFQTRDSNKYSLKRIWNIYHGSNVPENKDGMISFSIIHDPFVEFFIKKMTTLMENGQLHTIHDLANHSDTKKMKLVALINAGRVLYECLNSHPKHCVDEHYFEKSNRFVKYIYLTTEINFTLAN